MSGGSEKQRAKTSAARPGLGAAAIVFLGALMIAPVLAVIRRDLFGQPLWVLAIVGIVSLTAFAALGFDKKRAEQELRRVPENFLHLLELGGGWPGSFIAQRLFRHKTSKLGYQFVFWLIVAAYELISVDFLLGWKIAQQAASFMK